MVHSTTTQMLFDAALFRPVSPTLHSGTNSDAPDHDPGEKHDL
jgi:hypothetical protein